MSQLIIVGARPQLIKLAPLCEAFNKENLPFQILHTGQHYDANMSDLFFSELDIPEPDFKLNVGSASHAYQTAQMLTGIEDILIEQKTEKVITFGDTNSTLAGALAASKLHIPIAHIEAGLRSFNKKMPEEVNRIMTDHVSKWLFCPTEASVKHLHSENITEGVYYVGDIMYDATLMIRDKIEQKETTTFAQKKGFQQYILATVHRAENTKDINRMRDILDAFNELSSQMPIILPIHPGTKKAIQQFELKVSSNVHICEPLGIIETHALLSRSNCLLTDSGGMQKEAYFHKTPCITLRDETEWTETIDSGWNQITGSRKQTILNAFKQIKTGSTIKDYGDGSTSKKIISILEQ